jgi:ADP-heptose:LPS heptosyltransferase
MTRFAIFEPWGLGDLCIALHAARAMHAAGHSVVIVCSPAWTNWAQSLPYVETVIPFFAPWTQKRRKYDPRCYDIKEIFKLGRRLTSCAIDAIIDIRSDIRHKIFLEIICRKQIVTIKVEPSSNRYNRPADICKKLGIPYNLSREKRLIELHGQIACTFHAAWKNRELPFDRSFELVEKLLTLGWKVLLIVPDEKTSAFWATLQQAYSSQLELICTDLITMSERIQSAQLCVGVDSGIMHLAYLKNIPVIGLFGFKNHDEWLPPNATLVTCENTFQSQLRHRLTHENLDIEAVIKAIQSH